MTTGRARTAAVAREGYAVQQQQRQAGFTIAAVEGVTLTKWTRAWDERMPGVPLQVVRTTSEDQLDALLRPDSHTATTEPGAGAETGTAAAMATAPARPAAGAGPVDSADVASADVASADVAFVRLPIDDTSLSVIPLYEEAAFAVVPRDHPASVLESLTVADLAGEMILDGGWASAVELVAANVGVVIVPQSIARLHARGDVVARAVTDAPSTRICLVWPADRTTELVETFVGIVRGRGVRSSRSPAVVDGDADDAPRGGETGRAAARGGPGKGTTGKGTTATGAEKRSVGRKGAGSGSSGAKPGGRVQRQSAAEARAAANRRKRARGA